MARYGGGFAPTVNGSGQTMGVGAEFQNETWFDEQYERASGRYGTVLLRHNGRKGIINDRYLDYNQTMIVEELVHRLEEQGYSFGDWMDWLALQAVRPKVGWSALSVANYGLQSFFIDVGAKGRSDGLFNRLAAETISICYEFAVDCISEKVVEGEPEELVRKGFEEIAQSRKHKMDPKLLAALDDDFDAMSSAVEQAVKKKQGHFSGVAAAENTLHYEFGKHIAIQAAKLTAAEQQKLIEEPEAVLKFYNKHLKKVGLHLESDMVDKFSKVRQERDALRKQVNDLATSNAKGGDGPTRAGKEAENLPVIRKRSIIDRMFGNAGLG